MKAKSLVYLVIALVLGWQLSVFGDATSPAGSNTDDMRVQTLKPYTYAFVSTQTTLNKIQDAISQLMPVMDAAIDAGKLRVLGPFIFTYHGASEDRDKTFTLDIGVIVKDGNPAPDGIQVVKVGPLHCATVIYRGPTSGLSQAYGKLYGEIGRRGLQPTDVSREVYLYWEAQDSENNLIQIQADLAPAGGASPNQMDSN
jgi:effector-binding domain-containing protein